MIIMCSLCAMLCSCGYEISQEHSKQVNTSGGVGKDYLADKSKIIDEEIKKLRDVSGKETLCTLGSAFVGALGIGFMFSSLWPLTIGFASMSAYIANKNSEEKKLRLRKVKRLELEKKNIEKIQNKTLKLNGTPEKVRVRDKKIKDLKDAKKKEEEKLSARKLTSALFFGWAALATAITTIIPFAAIVPPIVLLSNVAINESKKKNGKTSEQLIEDYDLNTNTLETNKKVIELEKQAIKKKKQQGRIQQQNKQQQQGRQRPHRQATPIRKNISSYETAVNKYVENLCKQKETSKESQKVKK